MSEFKSSTPYLLSNPNKTVGLPSEKLSIPPRSQFTIGRSHENTLQILDNTISKKHSRISILKGSYFITDLSSANGIYLNGTKVQGQAQLEDGDCLQFGKYECLYQFVDPTSGSRNKSRGKGKINLKDYLFEQNPMEKNKSKNISQFENGQQSVLTQPISNKRQMPSISATQSNINRKKVKPKQSKIRIPDLSDYLKLTNGSNEQVQNNEAKDLGDTGNKYTRSRVNGPVKQGKIKLHSLEGQIPTDEDLKQFRLQKREKNIYVQQQQALKNIERQKRRLEQQKLKKELQQAKIAEDLLQKQLLLQQKVREEQEKVNKEKERLQEQFVKREQLKRQQQIAKLKQIQQKQRQMMSKIEQQRNRQQEQLKTKQHQIKQQSQSQYRKQYQKRKTELQTQAQALARQYENIYRETIKKVKTQIDNQQNTIQTQQKKQNQLIQSNQNINKDIKILEEQINKLKNQFIIVNGRNKACILYASDIQDKIDGLGVKEGKMKQEGYYTAGSNKAGALRKIQDSVLNARKLLKIKQKEYDKVMEEILSLTASIKQKQYGTSSDVADFLDTINENTQLISNLKKEYLELLEEQKAVQQIWESQLSQNTELQNRNRVLQSQITKNMSEIEQNTRDQIKKSTQQRLHMLKIMYHCPQNKKNAARFLIEEMLAIEQQTHRFRTKNEQMHKKITKIISQTEKYKRQNQYLSEILFSQDENGHHFDNMKVVINNLLAKIEAERGSNNVSECLQLANEAFKYQLMIQNQIERKKGLKENMRKICEMGLAPTQIKVSSKNPLVFFGDLLTNKQIEIERKKNSILQTQNEVNKIKSEIKVLDEKRSKISQALQKYKVEQLSEARRLLGKQSNNNI